MDDPPPSAPASTSSFSAASTPTTPVHPFANSTSKLEVISSPGIDVEEESRQYDQLIQDVQTNYTRRPASPPAPPSVFSNDIWMADEMGESHAFARDVKIHGWTNVGDKLGGGYIVYDCVVKTREGTTIHAHKRYTDFEVLNSSLHLTLPKHHLHFIPPLPPKAPLARYRPTFLERRRRQLQFWLSAVLLNPDLGGSKAARLWIME